VDPLTLHRPADLRAGGLTDDEIRRMRRAGELSAVRRGSYVLGAPPEERERRHLLAARAAAAELAGDAVLSHASAAVVHGLPVWGLPLDRVAATRHRRSGGRVHPRTHIRTAPLPRDQVVVLDGLRVASAARVVADVARTAPAPQAVAVADAALFRGAVTEEELAEVVARQKRWPGCPAARRVLAFADGRSESVGESRSRVAIARAGLPAPELQWHVPGRDGCPLGRVDFAWPRFRTVGEFDGRVKYGRLLRPGEEPGDAVFAEKLREDAIRDAGFDVVRWTWPELTDFTAVADRLRSRFHRR
jgi:hypothetical protein